jgi:hypothetical protein
MPRGHVSLELGHLYMEDFEAGPGRLREHFARVRPWAEAARALTAVGIRRPSISTCFLVDDYFSRAFSPAELVPILLDGAREAGLTIDYLARESGCAVAEGTAVARAVEARLIDPGNPRADRRRPPVGKTGWLAGTLAAEDPRTPEAMAGHAVAEPMPPADTRGHPDVFADIELWSETKGRRLWSCAFLGAVWQLARLGGLHHQGRDLLQPRPWLGDFPPDWDDLPPLVQLNHTAAPFAAHRSISVLPSRFLAVEHAVRVIVDHVDSTPNRIADRISYVFYAGP